MNPESMIPSLVAARHDELLDHWVREQASSPSFRRDLLSDAELRTQSAEFLRLFRDAVGRPGALDDVEGEAWEGVRNLLAEVSRTRAMQGFSPSETATFVFSLKQPLFTALRGAAGADGEAVQDDLWRATRVLDRLGLYTTELYQTSREEVIFRQQQELLELSTPVVKLWDGVVAVPLIGTLDSARTQIVMENLLEQIVRTSASVAIIDITGVPTVDTLVAQHLIKTVAAARLMGAECIISGIRPQIAQTIVHLGIVLENVITKATLADAIAVALKQTGYVVSRPGVGRT
jgi:rsbT co-antagonist protein RsbR